MELTIDKSGRVVLPKRLREHLGVGLSLKVEVKETPEGVLLKPIRRASGLVMKGGLLVHQGEPSPHVNWETLVDEEREDRIRRIAEA